jgi:hypothetical protein
LRLRHWGCLYWQPLKVAAKGNTEVAEVVVATRGAQRSTLEAAGEFMSTPAVRGAVAR